MTQRKNRNLIKVALVVLLLLAFKKKEKTGVFVPEDGEFGDFGTEGDFEETFGKKVPEVNKGIAPLENSVVFDSEQVLKPIIGKNGEYLGCKTC